MSGEFGDEGCGGFFHDKIRSAKADAEGGRTNGARTLVPLLTVLCDLAEAVSYEEASDSSESSTVQTFMSKHESLKSAVACIDAYLDPYYDVAAKALASAGGWYTITNTDGLFTVEASASRILGHNPEVTRRAVNMIAHRADPKHRLASTQYVGGYARFRFKAGA